MPAWENRRICCRILPWKWCWKMLLDLNSIRSWAVFRRTGVTQTLPNPPTLSKSKISQKTNDNCLFDSGDNYAVGYFWNVLKLRHSTGNGRLCDLSDLWWFNQPPTNLSDKTSTLAEVLKGEGRPEENIETTCRFGITMMLWILDMQTDLHRASETRSLPYGAIGFLQGGTIHIILISQFHRAYSLVKAPKYLFSRDCPS